MAVTAPEKIVHRQRRLRAQMPVNRPDITARCNGKCEVNSSNHHSLPRKPVSVSTPHIMEPISRKPFRETEQRSEGAADFNVRQRGGYCRTLQFCKRPRYGATGSLIS